jgi:lipid II isoglutaminyl synthase (glutamine-hydrolysing)
VKARARLAAGVAVAVNAVSRRLRLGGGSVIGGRAGLAVDPGLLGALAAGRRVALVSGTNGKTTTTRLLTAALERGERGPVATSPAGANLPAGLVAALAASPVGTDAVLEVDEGFLPAVAEAVAPAAVVLLNLSRDQLDRVGEVRMVAERWRRAASGWVSATVIANADDPLVAWAAEPAPNVVWVGAGQLWRADATGCPACGGRIAFDAADGAAEWHCTGCARRRPALERQLQGRTVVSADGRRLPIDLRLPGRCNLANAAMAGAAAAALGIDEADALDAMSPVAEVQGRFASIDRHGVQARLLLAKNPAGWAELLDLLDGGTGPVVIGINARIADGRDTSWLWDVPFERLAGRTVVATAERAADLAVRLRYAGVDHLRVADQLVALTAAGAPALDYVGNYTAFQQLRRRLGGGAGATGAAVGSVPATAAPTPAHAVRRGTPVPVPALAPAAARSSRSAIGGRRGAGGGRLSALRVVVVHPDLLGTYGDGGNGTILAARAQWRGLPVALVHARSDRPLPRTGDIYCLGGGEDGPQVHAAELLGAGDLAAAVAGGAAVLAVCAGYQVVGRSFPDGRGQMCAGVGLLDVTTVRAERPRSVGELVSTPEPGTGLVAPFTGFENHAAVTRLGPGVTPLGRVTRGVGNGDGARTDGAVAGRVVGTYMHGPALARNPALADFVLGLVVDTSLAPLDDEEEEQLRRERLGSGSEARVGGRLGRRRHRARRRPQPGVVPVSS